MAKCLRALVSLRQGFPIPDLVDYYYYCLGTNNTRSIR